MREIILKRRGARSVGRAQRDPSRSWSASKPPRPATKLRGVLFGPFGSPVLRLRIVSLPLAFLAAASSAGEINTNNLPPATKGHIDFVQDIRPLLENRCLKCHSDEKPRSHFRLTSREAALKGG